jgi:cyclic pyranopterin phosphate synthase
MSAVASRSGRPRRPPVAEKVLELLIDYACAAKCPFCYNPPLTAEVLSRRLSFQQAAERLYLKRREGYDGAWFTGGEPTQRPDLPRLLRLARKLGYRRIQIGTNGWRTSVASYAGRLAKAGLNYTRVSIHGSKAATHDRILGSAGAFEKAEASLGTLRAQGVSVGVNFVLCRWNLSELPDFARLAVKWRLRDLDLLFPHQRGMMELNSGTIGVTYAQTVPWLSKAFKVFRAAGLGPAQVRLVNFPPCVLPAALRPHAVDWSVGDFGGHALANAEGAVQSLAKMKTGQKSQGPRCSSCSLSADCAGFEPDYAAVHGDAEFKPVRGRR